MHWHAFSAVWAFLQCSLCDVCVVSAEKVESAQVKKMVDQVWQARLATADPLEGLLHKEKVAPLSISCFLI